MAQVLSVDNFPAFNIIAKLELSADVAEGATTLPVVNEAGASSDYALLIGEPGDERAEIALPSAVADESITVPAIDHAHVRGEHIYVLRGHKIRLYRAANVDGSQPSSDDDYSLVSTTTITADNLETEIIDSSGGAGYWYTYTFYNDHAVSPEETTLEPTDAVRGGSSSGYYTSVDDVRHEAGLDNADGVADAKIFSKLLAAQSEVKGVCASAGYTMPLQTSSGTEYVPEVIVQITLVLAAGHVLSVEYGEGTSDVEKEGAKKIKQARELLKQITKGELVLLDASNNPLARTGQVDGWPDETTADAGVDGVTPEPSKFTMSMKF